MNTIGTIEAGGSYRHASLEDVALVLGWPAGATEAYLKGEDGAIPLPSAAPEMVNPAVAAVSAARQKIINASTDELVEMRALVEELSGRETADEWLRKALRLRESVQSSDREQHAG